MIIRAGDLAESKGRKPYPIPEAHRVLSHFVVRETLPGDPFGPHRHDAPELWYIQKGEAILTLAGEEDTVSAGDLIVIDPDAEHGLRTESRVTWICMA